MAAAKDITWFTGFEDGLFSANVGSIDPRYRALGNVPTTSTDVRAGLPALSSRSVSLGNSVTIESGIVPSGTWHTCRFYIKATANPGATQTCYEINTARAGSWFRVRRDTSGNLFVDVADASAIIATSATEAMSNDAWHRVDVEMFCGAGNWTCRFSLDGGADVSVSVASPGSTTWTRSRLGGITGTSLYDDWAFSDTSGQYPLGDGFVIAVLPNADGTHSPATPSSFTDGSFAISGSNPAFGKLNTRPFGSATKAAGSRVQQTVLNAAHYLEVAFANTAETLEADKAIAVFSYGGNSNTAHTGVATFSNGTDWTSANAKSPGATTFDTAFDMSESGIFYKGAIIPAPSGGWTPTNVDLLKARIGKSGDVTPNPFWQNLMVEVHYTVATATISQLVAALASSSTTLADVKVTHRLIAALASSSQTLAGLKVTHRLIAALDSTSGGGAVVSVYRRLAASLPSTSVTGSALSVYRRLSAGLNSTSATGAQLSVYRRLVAALASSTSMTPVLKSIKAIIAALASSSTAQYENTSSTVNLSASLPSSSQTSGQLLVLRRLAAALASSSATGAVVSVQRRLSAALGSASSTVSALRVLRRLAANLTSDSSAGTSLSGPKRLTALLQSGSSLSSTIIGAPVVRRLRAMLGIGR